MLISRLAAVVVIIGSIVEGPAVMAAWIVPPSVSHAAARATLEVPAKTMDARSRDLVKRNIVLSPLFVLGPPFAAAG
jgi:hypothetical protein